MDVLLRIRSVVCHYEHGCTFILLTSWETVRFSGQSVFYILFKGYGFSCV